MPNGCCMLPGRISIKKEKLEDGITFSTVDTYNTIQEAHTQREDSGKGNYRCLYVRAIYKVSICILWICPKKDAHHFSRKQPFLDIKPPQNALVFQLWN